MFCQHVLSTCSVNMFCQHVLSTCSVNMFCQHVLSTCSVNMFCHIDKEMEEEEKEEEMCLDHPTLGTFSYISIKNVHFMIFRGNRMAGRHLCAITSWCVVQCKQVCRNCSMHQRYQSLFNFLHIGLLQCTCDE